MNQELMEKHFEDIRKINAKYRDEIAVYGIWLINADDATKGGWLRDSSGWLFQSPSRACAQAQLEVLVSKSVADVRPFE